MAGTGQHAFWGAWVLTTGCMSLLFAGVFEWVLHNPMCNLLFRCGCVLNWRGGTISSLPDSGDRRGETALQTGRQRFPVRWGGEREREREREREERERRERQRENVCICALDAVSVYVCGAWRRRCALEREESRIGEAKESADTSGWNNCNVHNVEGPHCPFCEAEGWYAWSTWVPATLLMFLTAWTCAVALPLMWARWKAFISRGTEGENEESGDPSSAAKIAGAWEGDFTLGEYSEETNASPGVEECQRQCLWNPSSLKGRERVAACLAGVVAGGVAGIVSWAAGYTFVGFLFQQFSGYPYFLWWG